jgi:hypothetical protein
MEKNSISPARTSLTYSSPVMAKAMDSLATTQPPVWDPAQAQGPETKGVANGCRNLPA